MATISLVSRLGAYPQLILVIAYIGLTLAAKPTPSPQPVSCTTYTLENECSYVIDYDIVDVGLPLQLRFEQIADAVSDVRMLYPFECRRGLITLLCGLNFPGCTEDRRAVYACEEVCTRLYDVCPEEILIYLTQSSGLPLNCSLLPLASRSFDNDDASSESEAGADPEGCTRSSPEVSQSGARDLFEARNEQMREVGEILSGQRGLFSRMALPSNATCNPIPIPKAIPVSTCRPEGVVPCCTGFLEISTVTGECAEQCPYYLYPNSSKDRVLEVLIFVLATISLVLFIIGGVPYLSDPMGRKFPNYITCIMCFCATMTAQMASWSIYAGGASNFICGDNGNDFDAFDFKKTDRCIAQGVVLSFFFLSQGMWSMWLATRMFISGNSRSAFWEKHDLPTDLQNKPSHKIIVHVTSWGIPFILAMILLGITLDERDDPTNVDPSVVQNVGYFCIASESGRSSGPGSGAGFWVMWLPYTIIVFITGILCIIIIHQLVRVSLQTLYLHWRATAMCVLSVTSGMIYVAFILSSVNLRRDYERTGFESQICFSSHPRDPDPPCPLPAVGRFGWFFVTYFVLYGLGIPFAVITFLTYRRIWVFWKELIVHQRVVHVLSADTEQSYSRNSGISADAVSMAKSSQ